MTDFREARAALWGFLILGFYFCAVLGSGLVNPADFWLLFRTYLGMGFALWFAIGIFATTGLLWRHRPKAGGTAPSPFVLIRGWFETQWAENRLARTLWPPILFAMLLTSFNAFKQKILATQDFAFDPMFAEADRYLFFGRDGWRFFHDWFGSPAATQAIDLGYHAWFAPMSVGVMICAFLSANHYRLRTQYLFTYLFVWIGLGSVMAYLLPSAGPCFYNLLVGQQPSYAALMAELNAHNAVLEATGGHVQALSNMHGLLAAREADGLVIGGGISAMPSVHNGLSVLFAVAAFRFSRWAGYALSAYAVLIWVGSVYLGWHYGFDGIVSAVLVIAFWKLSGLFADAIAKPVKPWSRLAAA